MNNTPFIFATLMHKTLKDLLGKYVVVYLDDIIVLRNTLKEHKKNFLQTLNTFERHKLVAKPSKCEFLKTELLLMGHIITAIGIKTNPTEVKAITKTTPPKEAIKLSTFLDMITYVNKFITSFDKLIDLLIEFLDYKRPFHWTPARNSAF